jgi:hypothetical protein
MRRIRAQAALLPAAFPVRVLSSLSFLLDTIHDRGKEVDENLHGAHRTVWCALLLRLVLVGRLSGRSLVVQSRIPRNAGGDIAL